MGGATLVYLELGDGQIAERGRLQLDSDVACLDITPVGEPSSAPAVFARGVGQGRG